MATKRQVTESERKRMIAEKAYFNSLERDPESGDSVQDWLKAEKAIDAKFKVSPHDKKLGQLYEQLAEANEKLRELAVKFKAEAREEWNEEVGHINKVRDEFSEKLEEIRGHTGEAKQRAKRQADKLWEDLVEGLKRIGAYPK
jgi:hypothetical protein